jgi:hypothetical protein
MRHRSWLYGPPVCEDQDEGCECADCAGLTVYEWRDSMPEGNRDE